MREVTKGQFRDMYFELGGKSTTGWDLDYWNKHFEDNIRSGMKYMVQEPDTPAHNRMMIVADYSTNEYRLFFMTEEEEEQFFGFPEKDG